MMDYEPASPSELPEVFWGPSNRPCDSFGSDPLTRETGQCQQRRVNRFILSRGFGRIYFRQFTFGIWERKMSNP